MNTIATDYPDFPTVIDSSMLKTFKSCEQRAFREYFQHLHGRAESEHLVAGRAYAKGLEVVRNAVWRDGLALKPALDLGYVALIKEYGDFEPDERSHKTCANLLVALAEYFKHYGTDTDPIQPYITADGSPCVEFSFAIELPVAHPRTGDPILYCGRFDMMGLFNGSLYVVDEKTTTQLGPRWINQWDMRSQFIGYTWAAQQHDLPVMGAVVRGISILKNDFGHAQAIIHPTKPQIYRWYHSTVAYVQRMIAAWECGEFLYNFDSACTEFSGCPYKILCDKQEPDKWIDVNFVRRVWNPMD